MQSSPIQAPQFKTDARDNLGAFLRSAHNDQPIPENAVIWVAGQPLNVWDIYTTLLAGTFHRHYTGGITLDVNFSYARHTKPLWFGPVRQPIYRLVAAAIFEYHMNRIEQREYEEQLQADSLASVGGEQATRAGILGAFVLDDLDVFERWSIEQVTISNSGKLD